VTGFGRCGVMWGQERIGLIADLVVLGGACGGGYPLGAVIAAPDWFTDGVDVSPQAAHPLICCAGLHTLNVVTMGVLEYMQDSSVILAKGLSELCAQFPHHLRSHHGDGLLRGLQFVSPERAARFPVDARSHNLHIAPAVGDVVVLSPVLITSTNEMTRGVDLISSVLMSWDDADMT
jgi:acetylornithine/succinyldiaminopimelate/putrescine aminotransferase